MAVEYKTWIEKANNLGYRSWFPLANTLSSLDLSEKHVQGNVLAVGIGHAFPERLLAGTPESKYRTLREEIKSLTLCDYNPELLHCTYLINNWLDRPPEIIPALNRKCSLGMSDYRFIRCDVKSFLLNCGSNHLFDNIMIFCIDHAGKELIDGLGDLIVRHLQLGGYVMGSGIFTDHIEPFLPGLRIEKLIELDRPTGIKNGEGVNLGFLARKPA